MAELTELEVEGMTCTNCALSVEKYLKKIGGDDISVNFATREVRFRNNAQKSMADLKKGIEQLGYTVVGEYTQHQEGKKARLSKLEKKLIVSAVFTFPLLMHMFLPFVAFLQNPLFQFILSLPLMYIGTSYFGKSAWASVKNGVANMDVLIFIGSSAAFIYSIVGVAINYGTHLVHQYMFFETGATIITLVLLGNWIEERSVQKTTGSLKDLVAMSHKKARLVKINLNKEKVVEEVDADHLLAGDRVQANSGDQIMADGEIVDGDAEMDESLITGESVPVFKEQGETVISGSIVVSGSIQFMVKKAGKDSTLSRIIELVKDAQAKKPAIQKLGDRVSSVFVPVVVSIALLTFLLSCFAFDISISSSLMASVAVLVISCPCAMGLATPTAVMVGVGKGAKAGVLLKGGDTIEKLAKVKTVVFDKTGTLTTGDFRVKNFETYDFDATVAKNIVLHMEKKSSHPIAKAIVKGNPDWFMMPFDYVKFEEVKGKGLYAVDQGGNDFKLGSGYWVTGEDKTGEGKDILLSYCGKVVAGFDIEDRVKEGSREAIMTLNKMGIKTVMISGDNEKKCRYVAERTGISEFFSGQSPEQKLEHIRMLKTEQSTAMVGDGINDAPALSLADVGISLGSATDIAKESAEVILLSGHISKVTEAIQLGKSTYRTIKQNLFWALAYNVVAIPIAAVGLLSPMIGALSMAFSDVVVVGNSIRLNWKK
ncbi:MAG: cadmium-translocating P-type ATPase [Bacteroidetes bacterium]|nr:cadmium-translocating P-type ATPase [Bacteroidota bacterium]